MAEEILPIETVDYLMIKWKKLASWECPKTSTVAVIAVSLAYWYLNWTDATTMNLILSGILYVYLSVTFAQTIWPEIRSDNQNDQTIDVREEEVSESEISFMIEGTKNYYTVLRELRKDSPGLFCLFTCGFLMLIGYVGSYFTILPLMFVLSISGLVLPIALRKSPWMVQNTMKYSYIICAAFMKFWEKLRSDLPVISDVALNWVRNNAEQLQIKLKIYVQTPLTWMEHFKRIAREKFGKHESCHNNNVDTDAGKEIEESTDDANKEVIHENTDTETEKIENEESKRYARRYAICKNPNDMQELQVPADPDMNKNVDQSEINTVSVEA